MKLIKYLPIIFLTGCTKATLVHLPSGDTGYAFQCEKAKMSSCYAQASGACGSMGYTILEDVTTIHIVHMHTIHSIFYSLLKRLL